MANGFSEQESQGALDEPPLVLVMRSKLAQMN
jgi:hypothetical protein